MDLIARPGGYGLNSEGYGCGTLADVCDYSTYFSGSIKAGGGGGGYHNSMRDRWSLHHGFVR